MGHSSIRIKVRRRKVANLAANSRRYSVKNCTTPVAKFEWKTIPFDSKIQKHYKEKYPSISSGCGIAYRIDDKGKFILKDDSWKYEEHIQPKNLHKRIHGQKWIKHKDGTVELKKWDYPSTYPDANVSEKKMWKNLGKAAKMKAYENEKVKKWERKHPKPCKDDDLFKDEMIPAWEREREQAIERIRDVVVSMFDKLPLTGRYKESDNKFTKKLVAELKDVNGEGHRVNELDEKSKLLRKAQKATDKEKVKNSKLVATNLKDHKRQKGRIILPKAA